MRKEVLLSFLFLNIIMAKAQKIYDVSFEGWSAGHEYRQSDLVRDGLGPRWVSGFNQSRCFIDSAHAHNGNNALRVSYPADGVGPVETGGQSALEFDGENEVFLSYWLRFGDDFDWGRKLKGGKLPGLAGGKNCSGGQSCDGTNGFSARLMWRNEGQAVLYLYHMHKPATWGEDMGLSDEEGQKVVFERGKWYNVVERVKINTGNERNGEVEIWINGLKALLVQNIQMFNNGGLVDNLYFSTFHGGNTKEWAPEHDCFIWFDDIVVSTDRNDVLPH